MPRIQNPHKKFQFGLLLYGMDEMRAQKVTTPEYSLDVIEHGEGAYKVKTAGMVNFSTFTIEKIEGGLLPDKLFWRWIQSIVNARAGTGLPAEAYKQNAQIFKRNVLGVNIGTWVCEGVFPMKINGVELDRVSSENTIETIEFSVDLVDFI